MSNNNVNFDATSYATTQALDAISMDDYYHVALQWDAVVATPATKTFSPGVAEISEVICAADAGVKEIQTMTFPTKAAATQGDYIVFYDTLGKKYAVSIDKDGTGVEPTGAIWAGIVSSRKKVCYIGAQTTAAQVAAKALLSIKQIEEYSTSIFTWVDSGSGVLTGTQAKVGAVTNPVPKSADDSGAGGLLGAQSTGGVASSLQNTYFLLYAGGTNAKHAFWMNVNSEGSVPTVANATMHAVAIAAGAADTAVATAVNTVVDAMDEFSSSKVSATLTITAATKGNTTNAADTGLTGFTITTPTAGVDDGFANGFTSDQIVIASHGFSTGLRVGATSDTTLPAPLTATNYWVRKIDANTISLFDSAAHAIATSSETGRINITDAGVGIHTLAPAALSACSISLEESVDGTNWTAIASATANITATAVGLIQTTSKCQMIRPKITLTTGQLTLAIKAFLKEE